MSPENNDNPKGFGSALAALGGLQSTPSTGLLGYFGRVEVNGLYYRNQQINLDGYTFIGCRFDQCSLSVNTLNFELLRCIIDPSSTILYSGNLVKVIKLFNSRYDWTNGAVPNFAPSRNPDGTITISERV